VDGDGLSAGAALEGQCGKEGVFFVFVCFFVLVP